MHDEGQTVFSGCRNASWNTHCYQDTKKNEDKAFDFTWPRLTLVLHVLDGIRISCNRNNEYFYESCWFTLRTIYWIGIDSCSLIIRRCLNPHKRKRQTKPGLLLFRGTVICVTCILNHLNSVTTRQGSIVTMIPKTNCGVGDGQLWCSYPRRKSKLVKDLIYRSMWLKSLILDLRADCGWS